MTMKNYCEVGFVRSVMALLLVLMVLGAGMPGEAFARVDMQNGHEGDPDDGMDIVGGGSGDPTDGHDSSRGSNDFLSRDLAFDGVIVEMKFLDDGTVFPVFSLFGHSLEGLVFH